MNSRRGATLVEVMLAGAIVTLLSLALFEGIAVASRIAHENAELLSAEAVAWDAVWKKFNEEYSTIVPGTTTETLSSNAAPALVMSQYSAPVLTITVSTVENYSTLRCIEGDVEWGPSAKRRRLSDSCPVFVYRGELGRVVGW